MSDSQKSSELSLTIIGEYLDYPNKVLNLDDKVAIDEAINIILEDVGGLQTLKNELRTSLSQNVKEGTVGSYLTSILNDDVSQTHEDQVVAIVPNIMVTPPPSPTPTPPDSPRSSIKKSVSSYSESAVAVRVDDSKSIDHSGYTPNDARSHTSPRHTAGVTTGATSPLPERTVRCDKPSSSSEDSKLCPSPPQCSVSSSSSDSSSSSCSSSSESSYRPSNKPKHVKASSWGWGTIIAVIILVILIIAFIAFMVYTFTMQKAVAPTVAAASQCETAPKAAVPHENACVTTTTKCEDLW